MSDDEENEVWNLISSQLKVPAEIIAVTSKSKTTTASGNSKNKANNSKVEVFSGYLKDYKVSAKENSTPTLQKTTNKI
jgi:hypothetical protein